MLLDFFKVTQPELHIPVIFASGAGSCPWQIFSGRTGDFCLPQPLLRQPQVPLCLSQLRLMLRRHARSCHARPAPSRACGDGSLSPAQGPGCSFPPPSRGLIPLGHSGEVQLCIPRVSPLPFGAALIPLSVMSLSVSRSPCSAIPRFLICVTLLFQLLQASQRKGNNI